MISRSLLSRCQAELGAFMEGLATAGEGLRVAEEVDPLFRVMVGCSAVGHLHRRQGNVRQAIPVLERAVNLCKVWHIPFQFPLAASDLGLAYAMCGRLTEGVPLAEHAISTLPRGTYMAHWLASLGEAYLLTVRLDDAHTRAVQALERSRAHKERGHQAGPCDCSARFWRIVILRRLSRRKPPIVKPSPSLTSSACARSWPTALRGLARYITRSDGSRRPMPNCAPPSSCTAQWR